MGKSKRKLKKIAGTLLVVCACVFVVFMFTAAVWGKKRNAPVYLFGYTLMRVETGSMQPKIPAESYILAKKYRGQVLVEGDIIVYRMQDTSSEAYGQLIVHRIVKITEDGYETKGDAALLSDREKVQEKDVEGVFVKNLPGLTWFGKVYASPLGLIAIVGLFIAVFAFVYVPEVLSALREDAEKAKTLKKQKLMDERVKEEVEKMLQNPSAYSDVAEKKNAQADEEEKQVKDEEFSEQE